MILSHYDKHTHTHTHAFDSCSTSLSYDVLVHQIVPTNQTAVCTICPIVLFDRVGAWKVLPIGKPSRYRRLHCFAYCWFLCLHMSKLYHVRTLPHNMIRFYTTIYHSISYNTVLKCTILHYTILYYTILYHTILYYIKL